jgi:hypothetical protein
VLDAGSVGLFVDPLTLRGASPSCLRITASIHLPQKILSRQEGNRY